MQKKLALVNEQQYPMKNIAQPDVQDEISSKT